MVQGIESIVLVVRDKQRSLKFYERTIGLPLLRQGPTSAVLSLGSAELVLQEVGVASKPYDDFREMLDRYPRGLGMLIRLRVADVDRFHSRLREEKVAAGTPAEDRSSDYRAFEVVDPDGYRLLITGLAAT